MKKPEAPLKSKSYFSLLLLLFLSLSFFPFTSFGQSWSIGPKFGITSATGAGSDVPDDVESITGFVGGVFVRYNTGSFVALQPEVLYIRKGGHYREDLFSYKLTTNYLEVPLLVKLQVPVDEMLFPFIYAGPYGAFELSNETEGELFFFDYESSADLNNFDAGMVVGAGVDLELNRFYLGFDARYGIGMVNIYEPDNDGGQPDIKNRTLSFMLGLGVNLDQ